MRAWSVSYSISFAHGSSWTAAVGRHVKTLRMLRESSGRAGIERSLNSQQADRRVVLNLRMLLFSSDFPFVLC
jgi:hypothetical protein